jgi:hypothetical protein
MGLDYGPVEHVEERILPFENDGLHWPRRDGLKWPHFASVDVLG